MYRISFFLPAVDLPIFSTVVSTPLAKQRQRVVLRRAVREISKSSLSLYILLLTCILTTARISPTHAAPLRIVTTTSIISNTVAEVGGDPSTVTALMGAGVDPHLYKASPGDLRLLASADLIFHHGLHLEGKLADILEKLASKKPVIAVSSKIPRERLRRSAPEGDAFDPHVWLDPALWRHAAETIRDSLLELDPEHAERYRDNTSTFCNELDTLHLWSKSRIESIPPQQRVLITAHDAFGYFGSAYGIEVQGIQGISTDSEASLREVTGLIDRIVTQRIPAVFAESSVSQKGIQALIEGARARGYLVKLGGELLSDSLGAPETPEGTYVGMIRHNVEQITTALRNGGEHK